MKRYVISSLALLLLSGLSLASNSYDYPIKNPLLATVIGTPSEFVAPLPKKIRRSVKSIVVFPDRVQPSFAPGKKMPYTLVSQKKTAAPLIFNIAGTGASHASPKMQMMEKAFYQAGFHVVSLPSPTYFSFIMRASTTSACLLIMTGLKSISMMSFSFIANLEIFNNNAIIFSLLIAGIFLNPDNILLPLIS